VSQIFELKSAVWYFFHRVVSWEIILKLAC
jgi:hypothetical protein